MFFSKNCSKFESFKRRRSKPQRGKNEDKELWLRVLKWIDCLYLELPLVYYTINNVKEYN